MKLYHFPPAPNPARVLYYLKEKGIEDIELVLINFREGAQRTPEHLARSPRGTVPVLELDDGGYLTESLPIMEYLEEHYPEPPLIGANARRRAEVRCLERYIELNVLLHVVRLVHATNSPIGRPPNPALADYSRETMAGPLVYVDELVGDGPFVAGDAVTIADCTLLAALRFARLGEIEIDAGLANLHAWHERFAARHV